MKLHIAKNFSLPTEAITQTFAILAKRGVGKTYTASVMAEEQLWRKALRDGAYRMLEIVVSSGEAGIPLEALAESVNMTYGAGTFSTYTGDLRRNGLITVTNGIAVANDILFP